MFNHDFVFLFGIIFGLILLLLLIPRCVFMENRKRKRRERTVLQGKDQILLQDKEITSVQVN